MNIPRIEPNSDIDGFQEIFDDFWKWIEYLSVKESTHDCTYEVFHRKFPLTAHYFSYKNMQYSVHVLGKLERMLQSVAGYKKHISSLPLPEQEKFRDIFMLCMKKYRASEDIVKVLENILFPSSQRIRQTVRHKTQRIFEL